MYSLTYLGFTPGIGAYGVRNLSGRVVFRGTMSECLHAIRNGASAR